MLSDRYKSSKVVMVRKRSSVDKKLNSNLSTFCDEQIEN